jgi:predicted regulator of Ras-like GTPase activity (Roadblock/LC7/MglB family)
MSMHGVLADMAVADLIQHNCQDRKTARMVIENSGQQAALYFKAGQVVHATLDGHEGEEVVFQLLTWVEGTFALETGVEAPAQTIKRNWSGLLMEGAQRLDESQFEETDPMEVSQMAPKLNEILKELSGEVAGYISSVVVGMDGLALADHTKSAKSNPEAISAQLALLFKLVDTSSAKMNAGIVEDALLSTDGAHVLMRFLPGKDYFLGVAIDRKAGNLGNLRLMSKLYADRIARAMPR